MAKKKNTRRKKNAGSVYQLPNGKWCGVLNLGINEHGKRQRKYIYGDTEEQVTSEIERLTGKLTSVKKDSVLNSCEELMLEWLLVFRKQDVTSRVFENDMRNFRIHIKPFIRGLNILDVDSVIIKKILNKIYDKNKSMDVQKKTKTLMRQFFDYAVEEKLVQYNPVLSVKIKIDKKKNLTLEDKNKDYKAIKPEHRKKYLEALCQNKFLLNLCFVGYYMGLRIGEILALKWNDIDLINETMAVTKGVTYEVYFDDQGNKTGKKTIVSTPKTNCSIAKLPVPSILCESLKEWHKVQAEKSKKLNVDLVDPNCFIFCNDDGSVRTYYGTRDIYENFLKNNDFTSKEFHFHALRYTFGQILKEHEENLYNIQMLLRHANAKTTERYLSMDPNKALKIKTRLNDVFESASKQDEENYELEEMLKKRKMKKDFEM